MALTDSQRALLGWLNQLSQNLGTTSGANVDFSVDLPGLDVDFGVDIGGAGNSGNGTNPPPGTPRTMRELLLSLVNEQVQVTTPFGTVTGTLLLVKKDYIVIIEATGEQVLVRIDKIELVSETGGI
ncbi:DUF2642 domain-containing protein [Virgibacillus oceani]|uniref:DUF2642 domain-containing protein n=1 Tax=Virgibacillus oceani TaxID=1479511 RepID=A0A917M3L0_9BACI|nr:DUF2642 domain-containing protein [Virgibacillus oceani]GGG75586.1 hypothetical protein GCM10011398_20540 [Virgibacillus oceani]